MTIDSIKPKCESESERCGGEVTFAPNPFSAEIHNDHTEVWMCEEHRYQSAMDI